MNYDILKRRDSDLSGGLGTKEVTAIFNEIDDARKKTDLDTVKVLEIGCGSGKIIERLKNEFGIKNIKGIDIDDEAVKYCKAKGLEVEKGDGTKLKFMDNEFDIVFANHLLDTYNNPKIVKEALRVAKKAIFLVNENSYNLEKFWDKAKYETHKVFRDVVVYQSNKITYRHHIIVFYRSSKRKLKGIKTEVDKNDYKINGNSK